MTTRMEACLPLDSARSCTGIVVSSEARWIARHGKWLISYTKRRSEAQSMKKASNFNHFNEASNIIFIKWRGEIFHFSTSTSTSLLCWRCRRHYNSSSCSENCNLWDGALTSSSSSLCQKEPFSICIRYWQRRLSSQLMPPEDAFRIVDDRIPVTFSVLLTDRNEY